MSEASTPNPYAAPTSNLQELPDNSQVPSIEEALARGYDFNISMLINEAWLMVKGTKGIIIGGFLVFYVLMFVVSSVAALFFGVVIGALSDNFFVSFVASQVLSSLVASFVAYPILAGVSLIGIRRAAGQPINFNEIFSHFGRLLPLIGVAVVQVALTFLAAALASFTFGLIIIPVIYLTLAYMLAIPLVVERGLSTWQALEASRKAITQRWFKTFGLFLLLGLITMISALPLGIGLIWSIPLFAIAMGVLYRTIFGVLPVAQ